MRPTRLPVLCLLALLASACQISLSREAWQEPDRVIEGGAAADDALDAAQLPDHIQDALRELPIDYRSAVVLSDVVGLTYGEIGDALDIPVGTVRSRLHRGRLQLREQLEGQL